LPSKVTAMNANIIEGPGGFNFGTHGDDVHVVKNSCEGKFVPFPGGN